MVTNESYEWDRLVSAPQELAEYIESHAYDYHVRESIARMCSIVDNMDMRGSIDQEALLHQAWRLRDELRDIVEEDLKEKMK